ncbi:hypothetical protein [Brevibacillus borstelensis]|uniref:hypothetical protein n=1 Tax=Brevibacillus borstelensis TaxID=45462 RepID=UPI00068CAE79|nr:hypothetical protein [Brevibacillus borstelensis]
MIPENVSELLTKTQLYHTSTLDNEADIDALYQFLFKDTKYDCFCTECEKETTFQIASPKSSKTIGGNLITEPKLKTLQGLRVVVSECMRNSAHCMIHLLLVRDKSIVKIGQYPSIADILNSDIKKYRKILGEEKYREFSKAIGLASHGIGIGSFIYLRRILEGLIEEARNVAKEDPGWSDEEYQQARVVEKIVMLKEQLPKFLVDNKGMYSILSKGVHELSEAECNEFFPAMQLGIELILDERIEKMEREEKLKTASKDVAAILGKLKS